ncbi:MAG TPA: hypothetical protein VFV09_12235 [Actinomycetota bacterium]|nr:hypothetical protein [Actinomycetota bacterium]
MKVAVGAAVLAAFVLGLAISGVVGRVPSAAQSDTINLTSDAPVATPTPPVGLPGDPEKVSRHVESWDDKGGDRKDEDSSGSGSAEEQATVPAPAPTEDREDNSGRGSRNSGSGSENSGSGSIDSDLRGEDD